MGKALTWGKAVLEVDLTWEEELLVGSFYLAGSFHQLGKFSPASQVLIQRVLSPKGTSDLGEAPTWNGRKLSPGNRSQPGHLTWRKALPC